MMQAVVGRRSGVVVRADVRRDSHGFEDIDDFWADESYSNDSDSEENEGNISGEGRNVQAVTSGVLQAKTHTHLRRRSLGLQKDKEVATTEETRLEPVVTPVRPPPLARLPRTPEPPTPTPPPTLRKKKRSPRPSVEEPVAVKDEPSEINISFGNISSPASTVRNDRDTTSMDLSGHDIGTPTSPPRSSRTEEARDVEMSDASLFSIPRQQQTQSGGRVPSVSSKSSGKASSRLAMPPSETQEESARGKKTTPSTPPSEVEDENPNPREFEDAQNDFEPDFDFGEGDDIDDNAPFNTDMTPIPRTEDHELNSPDEPTSPVRRMQLTTPPSISKPRAATPTKKKPTASRESDNEMDDEPLVEAVAKQSKQRKEPKKTKGKGKRKNVQNDDTGAESNTESNAPPKNTKGRPRKKKARSDNDEANTSTENATPNRQTMGFTDDEADSDLSGLRRSKRRRIKPLEWYKCERPVYERRDNGLGLILPTISHIERAGTTTPVKNTTTTRKKVSKHATFPKSSLPSEYTYLTNDSGELWDEASETSKTIKMIGRYGTMDHVALPTEEGFPSCFAGQTFNISGGKTTLPSWVSGRLLMPPLAVKQPESVGSCTQLFVVVSCQPGALEVAYGHPSDPTFIDSTALRFTLSPGDEFYVPTNNAYYVRNHSKTVEAELRFTILKPKIFKDGDKKKKKKTK
ncbi:hypothetical protein THRCLA_08449 [Thraustotheca clavata]|uniref:Mif2 N-terminal domain-containing protein n=1 Tax=Thraustotheca clavata TaxID=74557 RepID=A0A1V9Z5W9_9STRA|nr:hypothetical protein THRCLA_08449 [Thraustotheca clavata]